MTLLVLGCMMCVAAAVLVGTLLYLNQNKTKAKRHSATVTAPIEPPPDTPPDDTKKAAPPDDTKKATAGDDAVQAAAKRLTTSAGDALAYTCTGSSWTTKADNWTNGFMAGCWWKMHALTDDAKWKALAEQATAKLEGWKTKTTTHDVGFVIMSSFGNAPSRDAGVITAAARSLAKRYVPDLKVIRSWDQIGAAKVRVIIDSMMNLKLLFEAAKMTGGDKKWTDMAATHATTLASTLVRDNGSTYHVVEFEGGKKTLKTHQGKADSSTWARGQAWAIHGFTEAYEYTQKELFKDTAEKCAKYFIDNLPSDNVPLWDFDAGDGTKDTSAAAIAACGLFKLGKAAGSSAYTAKAKAILGSLKAKYQGSAKSLASLLCCATVNKPKGDGVNVGYVVADYYYLCALELERA